MIIKSFELNKLNFEKNKFFLTYGDNPGAKEELINLIINKKKNEADTYFETDIISNPENFFNSISSKSFFSKEKIIIIKKVSNKIFKIIEEIINKEYEDLTIILNSETLDKKSKLRSFFEKDKNLICIPFYPDDQKTLNIMASNFLRENKINLSQECINIITERSNGSRKHLDNELMKIKSFSITKKKIDLKDILILTNLGNEYKISELVDNCLAKNKFKVLKFINESNFKNEDTILIIRTFLLKAKRLLKLNKNYKNNSNLDNIISTYKPPIFWKEKEIIKSQMKIWSIEKTQDLIREINTIEYSLKRTPQIGMFILNNFILKI
tara:strand:+ start:274 stop:1248 length:975 start_codon:yes stop_codon:yes gene_type:complete